MAQYYRNQSSVPVNETENPLAPAEPHILSEFDKLHETLLADDAEEGWAPELCHYLNTME